MATESYVVGPGTLVVGETGSEQTLDCQITSAIVEWDVDAEDDVDLLCGEVLAGEEKFTATISGNLLQDLSAAGFVRYSWAHKGEVLPVEYIPNTAEGARITGNIKIRPVSVGGDAKARAASDFEFPFVGEPAIGNVTP